MTDFKYVKHNNSVFSFRFYHNFDNATSNGLCVLVWKVSGQYDDDQKCLTLNGDIAKTHDPTKHKSPELAKTDQQAVHSESTTSEKFTALAPWVWCHGMYCCFSIFLSALHLSSSSLKEPKYLKLTELYSRNQDVPLTDFSLLVQLTKT